MEAMLDWASLQMAVVIARCLITSLVSILSASTMHMCVHACAWAVGGRLPVPNLINVSSE